MLKLFFPALIAVTLAWALPARAAAVIDTFNASPQAATLFWRGAAQTFQVPAGNQVLTSWRSEIDPRIGGGTLLFSVYSWSGNSPMGSPLYSMVAEWPQFGGQIQLSGIDLALNEGQLYGAVFDFQGYNQASLHYGGDAYAGGNGFWSMALPGGWQSVPEYDLLFRAEFTPVPEPSVFVLLALSVGWLGWHVWRKKAALPVTGPEHRIGRSAYDEGGFLILPSDTPRGDRG